jgi:hypothetical protein
VTSNPDYSPAQGEHAGLASVEELARRKGIEHIKTIEELACDGVFDTDEEVEEFLAFVTEQRHSATKRAGYSRGARIRTD